MSRPIDVLAVMKHVVRYEIKASGAKEWVAELREARAAVVELYAERDALLADVLSLRGALLAADNSNAGLVDGIEKALDEIADDGRKALQYAAHELNAALGKFGGPA